MLLGPLAPSAAERGGEGHVVARASVSLLVQVAYGSSCWWASDPGGHGARGIVSAPGPPERGDRATVATTGKDSEGSSWHTAGGRRLRRPWDAPSPWWGPSAVLCGSARASLTPWQALVAGGLPRPVLRLPSRPRGDRDARVLARARCAFWLACTARSGLAAVVARGRPKTVARGARPARHQAL